MKTKIMLLLIIFLMVTFIGTAKPEQTQTTAKSQPTTAVENKAADAEKAPAAVEEQKKEAEKVEHKCSEECLKICIEKGKQKHSEENLKKCVEECLKKCGEKGEKKDSEDCLKKCTEECLKKCTEKGEHKCSEECLKKCAEKGEHKCIVKCIHKGEGDAKEKKIVIIINDDEKEKGDKEKINKIIICPKSGSIEEKDIEKHLMEIEKSEGKEGKCCKHVMICSVKEGKEGAEPKIVEIHGGKEGEEEKEIVILKKGVCGAEGKNMKMELISENKITGDVLNKIKELVKDLQGKLPELCKVNSELSETAQKIIIDCPLDKSDSEACKTGQKYIEEFEKEFKTLFPDKEGKKPLMKKIYIKTDEKVKEEK